MSATSTPGREALVRFDNVDEMPPAEPLSQSFRDLSDDEALRVQASDPDAGLFPPGFWDDATPTEPDESITLAVASDVLRFFQDSGTDYRAAMSDVLDRYVRAQKKAG